MPAAKPPTDGGDQSGTSIIDKISETVDNYTPNPSDGTSTTDYLTGWADLSLPDWLSNLGSTLRDAGGIRPLIRSVLYSEVLRAFARVVFPIFAAVSLLLFGTDPLKWASDAEINGPGSLGLADIPAYSFRMAADGTGYLIGAWFGSLETLIQTAAPSIPGPIDGIITMSVTAVVVLVAVIILKRTSLAIIELIPIIGPPLKTLLTGK